MTKVISSNFTLFESQNILTPAGEPLAITCSNDLLFVATEDNLIEAHGLETLERLAQFRTVAPAVQLAYNAHGDCVVTLERKHVHSHGSVRVYFRWRGLSADKPMRILMAPAPHGPIPSQSRITAEIIELPSDTERPVSCLACCEHTGRIIVAMESMLRVFTLEGNEDKRGGRGRESLLATPASPSASLPLLAHPRSPLSPSASLPPSLISSSPVPAIEHLLDINTNAGQLRDVAISGDYIAFISQNEVRVLKLSLFHSGLDHIPDYKPPESEEAKEGVACDNNSDLVTADSFVSWSPSTVWEAEKSAAQYTVEQGPLTDGASWLRDEAEITADPHRSTVPITSPDVIPTSHMTSHDSTPIIGSVTLGSVATATTKKLSDKTFLEVLGPVEYVWGHPLSVTVARGNEKSSLTIPKCRVLTMLYRRFPGASEHDTMQPSNKTRSRVATLPIRNVGGGDEGRRRGGDEGRRRGGEEGRRRRGEDVIHSLKLVPSFVGGPPSTSPKRLVGMTCFLANASTGFLYDIHLHTQLLSTFFFMSPSNQICIDQTFLYALSHESVDTYISRTLPGAISNFHLGGSFIPQKCVFEEPSGSGGVEVKEKEEEEEEREEEEEGEGGEEDGEGEREGEEEDVVRELKSEGKKEEEEEEMGSGGEDVEDEEEERDSSLDEWLCQPIPSHKMELTVVSSSKFIGSCYLATSADYMVVVTKGKSEQPAPSTTTWLLQSLTLRKAKAEHLSNIYVLKKRNTSDLYQQCVKYASSWKDTSPPLYQHIMSEGHILLRNELLCNGPSTQIKSRLQDNCLQLANSLCHYSKLHGMETHTAHYYIMSGALVADVIRNILSLSASAIDSNSALKVLMTYLKLVLFNPLNADQQLPALQPLANEILELFSCHAPSHMTTLLLHSWLVGYSPDRAITSMERQLETSSLAPEERYSAEVCLALLRLRAGDNVSMETISLSHLPKSFLQKWMNSNLQFVMDLDKEKSLTRLGKLVLSNQESCFLEFCHYLLRHQRACFKDICSVLQSYTDESLADQVCLKQFLEITILESSKDITKETITAAVLFLVRVLFARLFSDHAPKPSGSAPFTLYGARHKWLDSVPPFGDSPGSKVTQGPKVKQGQLQDLMQLQALMCSEHMSKEVAGLVVKILMREEEEEEEEKEEEEGSERRRGRREELDNISLSLKLISWPYLGQVKEACLLALQSCPSSVVDYSLSVLPDQLEPWVWLLETLLSNIQTKGESDQLYVSLYKEALTHVATFTAPKQFLTLLPPSGNVAFFLPFIELSCRQHYAHVTSDSLHASLR